MRMFTFDARRLRALEEYQGEHVTSALADAINDADNQVRRLAIHALGQRGDQARAHLPTLEMALKDSDPQIGRGCGDSDPSD